SELTGGAARHVRLSFRSARPSGYSMGSRRARRSTPTLHGAEAMTPESSIRPGTKAVTLPTLTSSVDLPRSPDGSFAEHRVRVSIRLPGDPSPDDVRIAEQRLRHLH